ncbi:MAG: hypothetical protein KAS78_03405 [Candidatus Pacebacteria bacterium]|nr:hypothetical protein [Candidatus Paceibacterota bacterium]
MQLNFIKENQEKMFLFFGFALVLSAGFFSGYFYFQEQIDNQNIIIEDSNQDCKDLFNLKFVNDDPDSNQNTISSLQVKGEWDKSDNTILQNKISIFVASKNSKIYHKPDCRYVKSINEENKIWFQSDEEPKNIGYSPHSCAK